MGTQLVQGPEIEKDIVIIQLFDAFNIEVATVSFEYVGIASAEVVTNTSGDVFLKVKFYDDRRRVKLDLQNMYGHGIVKGMATVTTAAVREQARKDAAAQERSRIAYAYDDGFGDGRHNGLTEGEERGRNAMTSIYTSTIIPMAEARAKKQGFTDGVNFGLLLTAIVMFPEWFV